MPKGMKPDYAVYSVVDTEDGKGRWNNVGTAFVNHKSKTITVLVDLLGCKLILRKPKPKDQNESAFDPMV